jgi:hypothetical protein
MLSSGNAPTEAIKLLAAFLPIKLLAAFLRGATTGIRR